jgi:hypothetical protein
MAEYRMGRYREAVATLEESLATLRSATPTELAFLAMARQQLGLESVATAMQQLEDLMTNPKWESDQQALEMLREARSVCGSARATPR